MKSVSKYIALFALLTLFAGCRKTTTINESQAILFQYDYINYAWGYQHKGFLIDNTGNIYTYDNPGDWKFPGNNRELSESDLASNLSGCTLSELKISQLELQKYSSYIKNISQSEVSAAKNTGADGGTAEYLCYRYSETSGIYKGILVKMEGDFTAENLNLHAKKVTQWLKDVSARLDRMPQ
ncbi:MAG: hypothetical protein MUD02_09155 [Bacteroidales bacterium]|jgi:hypothetical protein|nr:hypothetical protein [Bacteroidales bacterium]